MDNYKTSLELSNERWNIRNTGYNGPSVVYNSLEEKLVNTDTNGNNNFYTPPVRTTTSRQTITYDTNQQTYETNTTTFSGSYPVRTQDTDGNPYTTTEYRTDTYTIKEFDVDVETFYTKEEYISMTYKRSMGGEWKQGNNSYTDYYSYMLTSDFGGVSVSANQKTGTNWTSASIYSYEYQFYGYSLTWSWTVTTTITDIYTSSWHEYIVDELVSFDTNGAAVYEKKDRGWWNYYYDYQNTTVWRDVWDNWLGWWWSETTATRQKLEQGQGDLLVTNLPVVTTNINTYSKSYLNKTTSSNRPVYLSMSALQTLSKGDIFNPTNNSYSTTTYYNLGTHTVSTVVKTTTWEFL